jgi:hypothetical protein
MAGIDYDGIAGILRVHVAGEKRETFAIEVITFHAAIEHELEVALTRIIPRPDVLFDGKPKWSFAHKAKLLQAMWQGAPEAADKLARVLKAFQDLRDAVAHNDRQNIKSCNANLTIAFKEIATYASDDYPIIEVAQGICLFLADGQTMDDVLAAFDQIDKLINEDLSRAFGTIRVAVDD